MPIASASGATVTDAAGASYVDLVGSWGSAIAGHAHPQVVTAVTRAARRGLSFGATTEAEVELAEAIRDRYPPAARVRLVSTGTEATMTALRLARGEEPWAPDLVTFGKVIGGGLPVAAVAGRADLMEQLAPLVRQRVFPTLWAVRGHCSRSFWDSPSPR